MTSSKLLALDIWISTVLPAWTGLSQAGARAFSQRNVHPMRQSYGTLLKDLKLRKNQWTLRGTWALGYLDFWGTVVASHPSGGSLSSRFIPNDRPGDRLPVWSKIGGGAGVNGYGTEAVDE